MASILEQELHLEEIPVPGYEKVVKVSYERAKLKAIISIHSTALGPALGGTRIYPYATFDNALDDVMRLSKGMTYKSAASECGWGGGKSVIIADPKKEKTQELLFAFGEAVDQLQGQYICAEDVGCTPEDMGVISQVTPYVVGLYHEKSSGNPSPFTAWGTYRGIQSVLKKIYGTESVENRTIAIQGLGSVGFEVCKILFWRGAKLIVSDIDMEKCWQVARLTGAQVVSSHSILEEKCDVLSPCAMGGIINPESIPLLRCKAIAGCANNQLFSDADAQSLLMKGILYAPDFVINSGGLINVSEELTKEGYHPTSARNKVDNIYDRLMLIYDIAEKNQLPTHQAAVSLVDYRLKYRIGKRVEHPCFHHAKSYS